MKIKKIKKPKQIKAFQVRLDAKLVADLDILAKKESLTRNKLMGLILSQALENPTFILRLERFE